MAELSINVVGPATFGKEPSQTIKACVRCHERKVKCNAGDVPNGGPCRNCIKAKEICRRHRDKRTRSRASPGQSQTVAPLAEHFRSNLPLGKQTVSSVSEGPPTTPQSRNPEPGQRNQENALPGHIHASTNLQPASREALSYISPQDEFPFHQVEETRSESRGLGSSHLPASTSASSSVMRTTIQVNEPASERFEAFVGDSFGAFTPNFVGSQRGSRHESAFLPDQSGEFPTRLDVDLSSRSTIDIERQFINLDSEDMDYLRAKGAFDLPPRQLQEDMVYAYFEHVNPVMPIINRTAFLREFQANEISSRLLLFAIFTAGCKACQNPLLMDQYGTKVGSGHRFYKITKALLDTGYEQSKLVQIQALLLITWWWDKKDDGGKNMRGCAMNALNIAQSIGMSRWAHYPRDDPILRGVWKRIWWGCVVRDANVAMAHGLPTMLTLDSHDIHPLAPEDFVEEPGFQYDNQAFPYPQEEVSFYIHQAKVSELLGIVHSAQYHMYKLRTDTTGSIAKREAAINDHNPYFRRYYDPVPYSEDTMIECTRACEEWYCNLPPELQYDVDDIQGHRFWPAYLHILFFTILCTRHREKSVSKAVGAEELIRKHWSQAQGIAAATMISKIVRNLKAHGQIMKCTGLLTHSLFNCLIFCLIEGQSPHAEVRNYAQQKYSLCLNTLYDFSQLWLSASLIHRLFEALQANMNRVTTIAGSKSTRFYAEYLPNTHVSSEIGNGTMKRLLRSHTPFETSYETSDPGSASMSVSSHPASVLSTSNPSTSQFLNLDTLPPEFFEDNAEFPVTLNPQNWYDFFDLGKMS
ncbi:fungal-specific transcription factor domain-containing protein [Xylogone sp. PMI_703]|nr:fungal-specific transcription factor domain-containing protein [Xylogone sp. PMI_703]